MNNTINPIEYYITSLNLLPHPEGGFYKETFRSKGTIPHNALPEGFSGPRNFSTSIYFLLPGNTFSAIHRIHSDETWYFHAGTKLELCMLCDSGSLSKIIIGPDIHKGEFLQYTVPAECWFAAKCCDESSFTLVGCQVAPGFDFDDFVLADREILSHQFPQHDDFIQAFTRSLV
jgi:predicted cupin superfamily sugar epimerase